VGGGETAGFWGFWGELGVWDAFRGCFAGSSRVCCCSGAAGGSPALGGAGDSVVVDKYVDDDVAVERGGSRCGAGGWGTSWGERASVGRLLESRSGFWGWPGSSVEQTTRSDERLFSQSHNCVCRAADCRCGLLHVWAAASEVSEVVWVLDKALAVVSEVVVADIAAVVGSNVAVATGGSGCETRGWGLCN
jgi:hypothetical protein